MRFNIYKFIEKRPLSYSALNTFSDPQWGSPEKWYKTYIKGIRQSSKELEFGSLVDKRFQEDPTFAPEIPRYSDLQHKMVAVLEMNKKKIHLIGIADNHGRFAIRDVKTGKHPWTQKKADETEQLTFYALLKFLIDGIRPEEIDFYIDWLPTYDRADLSIDLVRPMRVESFKTKRTMADIVKLCGKIDKTLKEMQKYVRTCDKSNTGYTKAKVERESKHYKKIN